MWTAILVVVDTFFNKNENQKTRDRGCKRHHIGRVDVHKEFRIELEKKKKTLNCCSSINPLPNDEF